MTQAPGQTMAGDGAAALPGPGSGFPASGYAPLPGVYDEMIRADGRIRPAWDRLLQALQHLGPEKTAGAFGQARRHLRNAGVFFRAYGDPIGGERPWPLAPIPLVIDPEEWASLEAGVIQRATLVEAIIADIYGDARLVRDGDLPATVVTGSPDFARPLVGVRPAGNRHLQFYAVDLCRGPDGRWRVLADRTQSPSGAGYALENRIALNRAIPEVARSMNVERLAGFFQVFRDELARMNSRAEARVALLTPGPNNETYFEQAYLARYLGFLLLEGADITVRDGAAYVRTVSGLKRVEVLWRRLDGDFADPLELNASSRLGVPGLVQAVRAGGVTVVNSIGSGVIESRAMMSFMPALARRILGEELSLPGLATWWCGQPGGRDAVIADLQHMDIAPAFGTTLASAPSMPEPSAMLAALNERGADFVGQEVVRLSTMPVWNDGALAPRPFVLRLFVAAEGATGWTVMPGGFCRISDSSDARLVSLQQGASAADVWVCKDGPVADTTLLSGPETVPVRRTTGTLPSRAADNLFWLARYLERTEATLRLVRALLGRLADSGGIVDEPVIARLLAMLQASGALAENIDRNDATRHVITVLTGPERPGGLPNLLARALNARGAIRDRLAPDAFQIVTDLAERMMALAGQHLSPAAAFDEVNRALRAIAAFAGLSSENMNRQMGWRFLDLGRRIERGIWTARMVSGLWQAAPHAGPLDALLELGDSQIAYRTRYASASAQLPVLDLMVLDHGNPRSIAFQALCIAAHLRELPATVIDGRPAPLLRAALRLEGSLGTTTAGDLTPASVAGIAEDLLTLSQSISNRFFTDRPNSETPEELE